MVGRALLPLHFGGLLSAVLIMVSPACAACDPATNEQSIIEARGAIERYRNSFRFLKSIGLPVPLTVEKLVNVLVGAVEKGIDFGEAAGEVDANLQEIVAQQDRLCDLSYVEEGARWACYARVASLWQARNVPGVLDWNNTGSLVRRAAKKWLGSRCDRAKTPVRPLTRALPGSPSTQPLKANSRPILGPCVITKTC